MATEMKRTAEPRNRNLLHLAAAFFLGCFLTYNFEWRASSGTAKLMELQLGSHLPKADSSGTAYSTSELANILKVTNFSQLAPATVLDAAVTLDSKQKWGLAQLQQQTFCMTGMNNTEVESSQWVVIPHPLGSYSMNVYKGNDLVSDSLAGSTHSWEQDEVDNVLWALRQHAAVRQLYAGSPAEPLFVDVGTNVGTFSFRVAASGYRVASFEAMPGNVQLLRRTLCANPRLAERATLFATGLGKQSQNCWLLVHDHNIGNGYPFCDKQEEKKYRATLPHIKMHVRDEFNIRRLDTILDEDVQVMKMDVEGFEPLVLEGASNLLRRRNVWFIMAECIFGGDDGIRKHLRNIDALGYYISYKSFRGPFLEPAAVRAGVKDLPTNTIYCVKKALKDAMRKVWEV